MRFGDFYSKPLGKQVVLTILRNRQHPTSATPDLGSRYPRREAHLFALERCHEVYGAHTHNLPLKFADKLLSETTV